MENKHKQCCCEGHGHSCGQFMSPIMVEPHAYYTSCGVKTCLRTSPCRACPVCDSLRWVTFGKRRKEDKKHLPASGGGWDPTQNLLVSFYHLPFLSHYLVVLLLRLHIPVCLRTKQLLREVLLLQLPCPQFHMIMTMTFKVHISIIVIVPEKNMPYAEYYRLVLLSQYSSTSWQRRRTCHISLLFTYSFSYGCLCYCACSYTSFVIYCKRGESFCFRNASSGRSSRGCSSSGPALASPLVHTASRTNEKMGEQNAL